MKIFAVGWNYLRHNKEMNRALLPQEPVLFMKPDTALLKDGKPFFLPPFSERVEYETELVVRISRLGKNVAPRFAHRYYDAVTVGIDFTARDLQARLRAEGSPWEISKGFDGSAVVGDFVPVEELAGGVQDQHFSLRVGGKEVQRGHTADMIFPIDEMIAYISRFYTLRMGDLLFTGTPEGVGPVAIGDHLQGFLGERQLLDFHVR
ncbi:MAG TPA: fumarylacetoacetate hydrolase family protein [Candidatus Caccoplasma merdavium]|nr:fumarylacetoacetate hydrolase family protein [Candidatus Caccoplasma merdavium]